MTDFPRDNSGKLIKYVIKSNGVDVTNKYPLGSFVVRHEINCIGSAIISIISQDMSDAPVPESTSDDFKLGQKIVIELGYEFATQNVFEGIVVSQKIQIPNNSQSFPMLVVECKNEAVKATVVRLNRVFENKTDTQAVGRVWEEYGLSVDMDDTKIKHTQLVQYYCTDWDFLLSRADVYGMLVTTNGATVSIKRPEVSGNAVLSVAYGNDLLSFDGELCAEGQFSEVTGIGWNSTTQKIVSVHSSPASLNSQGDMSPQDLASATGTDSMLLQTDAQSDSGVLQQWVNSALLKTGLSRFRGSFSFCGNAAAVPGCIIELKGMGSRFDGDVFVGAVTHKLEAGVWITEAEMGLSSAKSTQQADSMASAASGLYPGIEGLHIGVVSQLDNDPDHEHRIQVKIPLLNIRPSTIWARLSQFAASKGSGSYFVPSVGDEVVLGFLNNDPNQAIILGCLYSAKYAPAYTHDRENHKRAFISPKKLTVELDDEKKTITISTPGKNSIVISDDAKGITLKDQNGNEIAMNNNGIKISSAKDITLSAKGDIMVNATRSAAIKSNDSVTINACRVTAKAQNTLKMSGVASAEISASGITTVKGAMVTIN